MSGGTVAGIDVGGTFTDILVIDERTGVARTAKVRSTRTREAAGFVAGLRSLVAPAELAAIVHGTTVATNALLERKGALCGLITTRGFRDILDMRRRERPSTWGLRGDFHAIVPRERRLEVDERTLADGTIEQRVEIDQVVHAAKALLDAGADALVIAFLNSYANDANELAALDAVAELWPNGHVTASSAMLREIREFERTSTAALNGYLQPRVGSYLSTIAHALGEDGFAGEFLVVQSNGGVVPAAEAGRFPVRTALSGPAAGVVAATHTAAQAGLENVITCDMGGTSFDVALVSGGLASFAQQTTIDFGLVIRSPMVEITTIGAGGGSIARVDRGGLLRVGPESAGSVPGPACYGQGAERATVTDANLLLGRIDASHPLGERQEPLDVDAARAALQRDVGDPLGLDAVAAAAAVIEVANARMAGAIRLVSVERGHDPARFALMPFGGAGSLHVGALLQITGAKQALIPRMPGLTSALGCVLADLRYDFVHSVNLALADLDASRLAAEMRSTVEKGAQLLRRTGVSLDSVDVEFELDMSYVGQSHTVSVPIQPSSGAHDTLSVEQIAAAFERVYRDAYGRVLDGIGIRLLTLRTAVLGRRPSLDLSAFGPPSEASEERASLGTRPVWSEGEWRETPVLDRLALPVGFQLGGPSILQQPDTTIFLDPGLRAEVDVRGNLVIEPL